ncbi:MAG TPA: ring-cleaving dioxygenase, partial [Anaerolineae bacterium]|nr:ring-cleaving dioxygenase [Anaerolineae bacterium]
YHLYYGDEQGRPGTILTFFPWPGGRRGRRGAGQVGAVSFLVPEGTLDYWAARLEGFDVTLGDRQLRLDFDEEVLPFLDPDGMQMELIAHPHAEEVAPWEGGPVAPANAIRGFHSVTLWENDPEPTTALLTETLGMHLSADKGPRYRFRADGDGPGILVDLYHLPDWERGVDGVGAVHHVAWRTPDDVTQQAWRQEIAELDLHVTQVVERQYFRSIYFREPGGILFEIATDPPGFTLDESPDELGTGLRLPPWLEPRRSEIEMVLPQLDLPRVLVRA